jgi:hypothetical protein
MGQQNEIVARVSATHTRKICASQKIFLIKRRLVRPARFLCCVRLDAAMHNRTRGTFLEIGFDFGIETGAATLLITIDACCAIVLSKIVHGKINDGS